MKPFTNRKFASIAAKKRHAAIRCKRRDFYRDTRENANALRLRGYTYEQIVDHLNSKGVPTFSGGRWNYDSVRRLCLFG